MKFVNGTQDYLVGHRFSTDLVIKPVNTSDQRSRLSRVELLERLAHGRNVIHVGCVDHDAGTIEDKLRSGKWLHHRLMRRATRCHGVDINAEGIHYMHEYLGIDDVEVINIAEQDSAAILGARWDAMLIPEVLEHIGNPVQFLQSVRNRYAAVVDELIVTVPNAFAVENFRGVLSGIERINTDHRFWFTPYTLAKVMADAGFAPEGFYMCTRNSGFPGMGFTGWLRRKRPLSRASIVMLARFGERTCGRSSGVQKRRATL